MDDGIELFERAAQAVGRLLKAQYLPAPGGVDAAEVGLLLLSFDVGRILVRCDARRTALEAEHLPASESEPPGLQPANEEEPWWRVLGHPVTRVWARREGGAPGVQLQFRYDEENPRWISLVPERGRIQITLDDPPGSA